ncbi:hypothetical protein [Actinomadura keratinilytica]|jgi:hypothetical protein|uniref:Uncharacterized protein n=1 Tax=Actinomadura keratinilytica TaxID=547461 RepID=A0ABP7ZEE4_9ACTN
MRFADRPDQATRYGSAMAAHPADLVAWAGPPPGGDAAARGGTGSGARCRPGNGSAAPHAGDRLVIHVHRHGRAAPAAEGVR